MIEDEAAREVALGAMTEAIRARLGAPAEDHLPVEVVLAETRARLRAAGDAAPSSGVAAPRASRR
ncbi:hypothetical protein BH23PSE1_BH23PSE1_14010 [soil metagenome]